MPRPWRRRRVTAPVFSPGCWCRCGWRRGPWSPSPSRCGSAGSILDRSTRRCGVLHGRRILLIIAGGIAAYKSLELIRRLRDRGAAVRVVMTAAAAQFVTPLSVASLSEDKVYGDLFSLTDESEMGHIRLSREADLLVVAPATADLMARMAAGMADDLAATTLLASDKPILIAPAMNALMWAHPATQANLVTLAARGVRRVGPNAGDLACGEIGSGR